MKHNSKEAVLLVPSGLLKAKVMLRKSDIERQILSILSHVEALKLECKIVVSRHWEGLADKGKMGS